ncbi:hypothetical protein FHW96_003470 [Novosphingobium sp. SG751A]|uniref:hypothetical protein n=1 Tax=Novosphingobium sp. SG751A TaxID=2587000 RepID=UPI001553FE1C|nr:hypothetical protein [Novosphingobium sp. SG751A]NOW47292.1 hypothetical protein [Novosphingobium sp. SG751A]
MRTNLEFCSSAPLADPPEDAPQGEAIARFLAERLPAYGFEIEKVNVEDWGWRIQIHHEAFPLWIGCGFYPEYPDGVLCFIEPAKPFLRRWFRKIPTLETVERLADALERIVAGSGLAQDLRWWSEEENARG